MSISHQLQGFIHVSQVVRSISEPSTVCGTFFWDVLIIQLIGVPHHIQFSLGQWGSCFLIFEPTKSPCFLIFLKNPSIHHHHFFLAAIIISSHPSIHPFLFFKDQKGIIKLADALQENKSLRVLMLSKNGITAQACNCLNNRGPAIRWGPLGEDSVGKILTQHDQKLQKFYRGH